ncbi:MAG: hypothetical protein CBE00_03335 [Planctomycetaceae bacterium TMED240]|nr:MAG: hypothetical protein CBE00_03335 [Planctomycetaceae bacterium TMED240]
MDKRRWESSTEGNVVRLSAIQHRKSKLLSETEQNSNTDSPLMIIGWREWLSLPDLGVPRIKAKIDTGARSSSLHAYDIEQFQQEGCSLVRFKVHPIQRREQMEVCCVAEVHDIRSVRSSSGEATDRIVIQTTASWLGQEWTIDLTLADRSQMGFRMLVGREAMRGRMLVDPGRSYFGGRPKRKKKPDNS